MRVKPTKIPLAIQASILAQLVYNNRANLQNFTLKAAVIIALGIAGEMVFTGGWSILEFSIEEVLPIYQEMMAHA
jgi:hypothetical protein